LDKAILYLCIYIYIISKGENYDTQHNFDSTF
jgi:hypothetical protein